MRPPRLLEKNAIEFAEKDDPGSKGRLEYKIYAGGFYDYRYYRPNKRKKSGWEPVKSWHKHWTHPKKPPHIHDDYWGHKQEKITNPYDLKMVLEDIKNNFHPKLDVGFYLRVAKS